MLDWSIRTAVLVEPAAEQAYTVFAEAMDRSGYVRGTLAPQEGMTAAVPALRERPLRTMIDMGIRAGLEAIHLVGESFLPLVAFASNSRAIRRNELQCG